MPNIGWASLHELSYMIPFDNSWFTRYYKHSITIDRNRNSWLTVMDTEGLKNDRYRLVHEFFVSHELVVINSMRNFLDQLVRVEIENRTRSIVRLEILGAKIGCHLWN
jgi:hypothetical protein